MAIQAQFYQQNLGLGLPLSTGSQDWMVDSSIANGCGFNGFKDLVFNNLQQKQQQQQQQQQMFDNSSLFVSAPMNNTTPANYNNINNNERLYFEKQRQEIDQYVRLQNEKLRLVLQEQRKQQLAELLKKIELRTQVVLAQKDQEIAQAVKRAMELESFLVKLEMENQAWQRVAHENEAMVVSLNNTLEQLREQGCCSSSAAEDAESCCDYDCGGDVNNEEIEEDETGQNRGAESHSEEMEQRTRKMVMVCKGCNCQSPCMVFLPCRHLCSCQACDAFLDSCPVCQTVKKASIEALF